MLKFYYNTGPNPMKVALCLEELGLEYEAIPLDTRKGDQHTQSYVDINPNAKAPSIIDNGNVVFDSNAILLYLGEKTGNFMPDNSLKSRADLLSWLMFVATGVGPYSGQSVHFQHMAPEKIKYAINRYVYEAERHYDILDKRLDQNKYMLGDTYTIVDMCVWGWARMLPKVIAEGELEKRKNLNRLMTEINNRPASKKALNISATNNHSFKVEIDEEASKFMFPQNERLKNS
ncbi:glutathione S-transferase N-terminal domain-containing protein [Alphaproteobacteria bacterium]|nr:glutathione S-transferase N-terminal domain-containing protein [Alphaproteobacteria bacterium]MDB9872502.1 glutathione S-transferase N-terminal domain-containing protein [Alphaproteobacteria bacterium]